MKAAQVHEKEFESVSIRDGPYQEDCPQVSQAPRKLLSTYQKERARQPPVCQDDSPFSPGTVAFHVIPRCQTCTYLLIRRLPFQRLVHATALKTGLLFRARALLWLLFRRNPRPTWSASLWTPTSAYGEHVYQFRKSVTLNTCTCYVCACVSDVFTCGLYRSTEQMQRRRKCVCPHNINIS